MTLPLLLEMAADGFGARLAFGNDKEGVTYAELLCGARRVATWLRERDAANVGVVDVNSPAIPLLLFGSGIAGRPFVPMNYRLSDEELRAVVARASPATLIVREDVADRVGAVEGVELVIRSAFLAAIEGVSETDHVAAGTDDLALLLFTSGTSAEPKASILRHRHLAAYVVSTIDFGSAGEDEASLISVPPYHVAAIAATLSSVYAGRRIVQLQSFDPDEWVSIATAERITHAMVVPTMLSRILDSIDRTGMSPARLRHLSYGGGRMPASVIERALDLLPEVDFVNAYGLTETSSTIAVLGPDDHRAAIASRDDRIRRRLGSVGRPLPMVELEIRDEEGRPLQPGKTGEVWVRGEQISGEYVGREDAIRCGWLPTRDSGSLDEDGYLYVEGRLDDVIVRGGENLAPSEIERVLHDHPAVLDAAVIGVPDVEWGETVMAFVVVRQGAQLTEAELRGWVKGKLRSSRTPEAIEFTDHLPYSETGKLLRRLLREQVRNRIASH